MRLTRLDRQQVSRALLVLLLVAAEIQAERRATTMMLTSRPVAEGARGAGREVWRSQIDGFRGGGRRQV